MLTNINIKGFKCFKSFSVPLANLTLLTGFNSGGKSTTLQSILLLAQGLRECQEEGVLALNGRFIRLGSPREILHPKCDHIAFTLENEVCQVDWTLAPQEKEFGSIMRVTRLEVREQGETVSYDQSNAKNLLSPPTDRHPQGYALVKEVRDTLFLSAIRNGAAELFPTPPIHTIAHADVGSQGEYGPWWFQRYMDEEIPLERRHPSEPSDNLRRQFQAWAGDMFPGVEANAVAMPEEPLATIPLINQWRVADIKQLLFNTSPPSTWESMLEKARLHFDNIILSDNILDILAPHPFNQLVCKQILELLGILENMVLAMDQNNTLTQHGHDLHQTFFVGNRSCFSDESDTNKRLFKQDLTFPDPDGKQLPAIFCPWHGKIQTPQYRVHFQWPIPKGQKSIKVLYIGPKITKK